MAQAVIEKPVCEKCGADVRDGTAFCYSCGNPLSPAKAAEPITKPTLNGPATDDKRSQAAEKRRKARVSGRKAVEYTWEPTHDLGLTLVASVVIVAAVTIAAVMLVLWK